MYVMMMRWVGNGGLAVTTGGKCFKDVFVLDCEMLVWSRLDLKPSPGTRHGHVAGMLAGGIMFVFGGFKSDRSPVFVNDLMAIDLGKRKCVEVKVCEEGPPPLYGSQLCTVNGRVLLVGGCGGHEAIFKYHNEVWELKLEYKESHDVRNSERGYML